jgi:WD40 repeat protein
MFRAVLSLFLPALCATVLLAQPPAAGEKKDAEHASPPALPEGARLRLGNTGLGVGENVSAAALSADGKYLAVGGPTGATLYDRATSKRLAQTSGGPMFGGYPNAVAFSPKGNVIATGGFRNVTLCEVPTGKLLHQLGVNDPNFQQPNSLTFSADGSMVACGMNFGANNKLKAYAWEVATGKAYGPFEVMQNNSSSTALSPDGKKLATWGRHYQRVQGEDLSPQQTVQLWEVTTGKELHKLKLDRQNVQINAVAFSPDGKQVAISSGQSTFHLYSVETGKEIRHFAGRRGQINQLEFSPDGKLLVAGSFEGTVQAWHADTGKRMDLPVGPKARIMSFAFPGEGQIIALGMLGQTLLWWDAVTGKRPNAAPGHEMPVFGVAFSTDGKMMRSIGFDGRVLTWDPVSGKLQSELVLLDDDAMRVGLGNQVRFSSLAISPDGRSAATSSMYGNNTVRLWDLNTGQTVCDFEPSKPAGGNFGLSFASSGGRLAAAGMGKQISIWDSERGEEVGKVTFEMPGNPLGGTAPRVACAPDGKAVAVIAPFIDRNNGGIGSRIQLLDVATGKEITAVSMPNNAFGGFGGNLQTQAPIAFSPDSKLLAMPAGNRDIVITRTAGGQEDKRLTTTQATGNLTTLAFSPDGRTLAVGYSGQNIVNVKGTIVAQSPAIELWELASGKLRATFKGHVGAVNCLAFTPDSLTLASGGADTTLILWDAGGLLGLKAVALTGDELREEWANLLKPDGKPAFLAQRRMILSPAETIAFLKKELQPAKAASFDMKQVDFWVANLDSDDFTTRDDAYRALEKIGTVAETALRKAKMGSLSLEMRRRVEELLTKLERTALTDTELQAVRAVEVAERIATPEARALVDAWAAGAPGAVLTRQAKIVQARGKR